MFGNGRLEKRVEVLERELHKFQEKFFEISAGIVAYEEFTPPRVISIYDIPKRAEIPQGEAIRQLAKHAGLQFKYVAGKPDAVELVTLGKAPARAKKK